MSNKSASWRARTWQVLVCSIFLPFVLSGAEKVPILNPADLIKGEVLEVEQVEITRLGAGPTEIQRAPGRFILVVTNNSKDPDAVYTLEPQSSAPAIGLGTLPILRFGGVSSWTSRSRLSSVVNAVLPGVWLLKSAAAGRTLCTITIQK